MTRYLANDNLKFIGHFYFRAFAALIRPPVVVFPLSESSGSTDASNRFRKSSTLIFGLFASDQCCDSGNHWSCHRRSRLFFVFIAEPRAENVYSWRGNRHTLNSVIRERRETFIVDRGQPR